MVWGRDEDGTATLKGWPRVKNAKSTVYNLFFFLFEKGCHLFEFKCNIFQGREMLKLDIAGESDPFCIITIGNKSIKTFTCNNSSNPNWHEGLKFKTFLYGTKDEIKNNPPEIIVEVYDEDPFNVIKLFQI